MTIETPGGYVLTEAKLKDELYYLKLASTPAPSETKPFTVRFAALIDFNDPVWSLHRRLGYLSIESIRKLRKQSTGIELTDK